MIRVRVKIPEGVAKGLCGNCDYAMSRTFDNGEQTFRCSYFHDGNGSIVHRPVTECSAFVEKNRPSKREMENIAWIIEVKDGKVAGFHDPEKAKKKGLIKRPSWEDE